MNAINQLFFELIRVSIGTQETLSYPPSSEEWQEMYAMAKKQSLIGICFAGVEQLTIQTPSSIIHLSEDLRLRWMGLAAKIQQRNEMVTRDVDRVREHFENEGMDIVLLKGQGNLYYYPENLRGLRTPGDIDAWVLPKGFENMPVKERMKNDEWFLRWLWKKDKSIRHCYIHVVYPQIVGSEVEVHFRPSYLNSPIKNRRLQRWMAERAPEQARNYVRLAEGIEEVAVPTEDFNVVYQLNHLYRHVFDDGVGLRQMLDYYFQMLNSNFDREEAMAQVTRFGMKRFCGAIMYVLHHTLGMNSRYLLCEEDADAGAFLLQEIMLTGNFGQSENQTKPENGVQRLVRRLRKNMKFLKYYAEEVLSVPIYRVYQEYWRIKINILCK